MTLTDKENEVVLDILHKMGIDYDAIKKQNETQGLKTDAPAETPETAENTEEPKSSLDALKLLNKLTGDDMDDLYRRKLLVDLAVARKIGALKSSEKFFDVFDEYEQVVFD